MEKIILDQIMKLSHQMGEMHAELRADINAQGKKLDSLEQKVDSLEQKVDANGRRLDLLEQKVDTNGKRLDLLEQKVDTNGKRLDSLEQKVDAQGQKMDVGFARIEEIIEENAKDTAKIFHDIFRNLGEKERKIINLYK